MNVNDFKKLQKRLEKAEAEYNEALKTEDKEVIQAAHDKWHRIIQNNEGPMAGFYYDEDTNQFKVSNGWHVDESGEIVKD